MVRCIFNEKECDHESGTRYCRDCGSVPDFEIQKDSEGHVIAHDMEYSLEQSLHQLRSREYEELSLMKKKNLPSWLKENIKLQEKERGKDLYKFPISIDHTRLFRHKKSGRVEYVTEPYGISMDRLKDCIEECEEQGLTFKIDGESHHLPGSTIRIVVEKKQTQ